MTNLSNVGYCMLKCTVYYIEEKNKDEIEEEDEFGDLDQLLRIERLKEQKRKKNEILEPEVDETQVSRLIPSFSGVPSVGLYRNS